MSTRQPATMKTHLIPKEACRTEREMMMMLPILAQKNVPDSQLSDASRERFFV